MQSAGRPTSLRAGSHVNRSGVTIAHAGGTDRQFQVGDSVLVRDYTSKGDK